MSIVVRKRSRLPHWHGGKSPYFVTWNLADAIPAEEKLRIEENKRALKAELERRRGELTPAEKWALEQVIFNEIESVLDAGHGECLLRNPEVAAIVDGAIRYYDLDHYELLSHSLMPNHVHVIFTLGNGTLDGVMKNWKGYTSRMANLALGRFGTFWQEDYFDRSIRDREHLLNTVGYVENNPANGGLRNWPWVHTHWDRIG